MSCILITFAQPTELVFVCVRAGEYVSGRGQNIEKKKYSTPNGPHHVYRYARKQVKWMPYILPVAGNKWVAKISVLVQLHTCVSRVDVGASVTVVDTLSTSCSNNIRARKNKHTPSPTSNKWLEFVRIWYASVNRNCFNSCSCRIFHDERFVQVKCWFSSAGACWFSGCDVIYARKQTTERPNERTMRVSCKNKTHTHHIDITEFMAENAFTSPKASEQVPMKIQFIYLFLLSFSNFNWCVPAPGKEIRAQQGKVQWCRFFVHRRTSERSMQFSENRMNLFFVDFYPLQCCVHFDIYFIAHTPITFNNQWINSTFYKGSSDAINFMRSKRHFPYCVLVYSWDTVKQSYRVWLRVHAMRHAVGSRVLSNYTRKDKGKKI